MRNERGITLIALVVTIIVLLILAGVTITYALSDNGIFRKAQDSQDAAVESVIRDAVSTAEAEALIEYYDPNTTAVSTVAELLENYLPKSSGYSVDASGLTLSEGSFAGNLKVTKGEKVYSCAVANGIVTSDGFTVTAKDAE